MVFLCLPQKHYFCCCLDSDSEMEIFVARAVCMFLVFAVTLLAGHGTQAEIFELPFSATIGEFDITVGGAKPGTGLVITQKKLKKQFSTTSFPFLHVCTMHLDLKAHP